MEKNWKNQKIFFLLFFLLFRQNVLRKPNLYKFYTTTVAIRCKHHRKKEQRKTSQAFKCNLVEEILRRWRQTRSEIRRNLRLRWNKKALKSHKNIEKGITILASVMHHDDSFIVCKVSFLRKRIKTKLKKTKPGFFPKDEVHGKNKKNVFSRRGGSLLLFYQQKRNIAIT